MVFFFHQVFLYTPKFTRSSLVFHYISHTYTTTAASVQKQFHEMKDLSENGKFHMRSWNGISIEFLLHFFLVHFNDTRRCASKFNFNAKLANKNSRIISSHTTRSLWFDAINVSWRDIKTSDNATRSAYR